MQNCTSSQGGINTRRRIDSTSSASSDSNDSSIRSITPPSFSEFEESDLAEPESLDDDCQGKATQIGFVNVSTDKDMVINEW